MHRHTLPRRLLLATPALLLARGAMGFEQLADRQGGGRLEYGGGAFD